MIATMTPAEFDSLFKLMTDIRTENSEAHEKIFDRLRNVELAQATKNGADKALGHATATTKQQIELSKAQWAGIAGAIAAISALVATISKAF